MIRRARCSQMHPAQAATLKARKLPLPRCLLGTNPPTHQVEPQYAQLQGCGGQGSRGCMGQQAVKLCLH